MSEKCPKCGTDMVVNTVHPVELNCSFQCEHVTDGIYCLGFQLSAADTRIAELERELAEARAALSAKESEVKENARQS
jgi:hypothetical protein